MHTGALFCDFQHLRGLTEYTHDTMVGECSTELDADIDESLIDHFFAASVVLGAVFK